MSHVEPKKMGAFRHDKPLGRSHEVFIGRHWAPNGVIWGWGFPFVWSRKRKAKGESPEEGSQLSRRGHSSLFSMFLLYLLGNFVNLGVKDQKEPLGKMGLLQHGLTKEASQKRWTKHSLEESKELEAYSKSQLLHTMIIWYNDTYTCSMHVFTVPVCYMFSH